MAKTATVDSPDHEARAVGRIVDRLEDAAIGIYMVHGLIPEAKWEKIDEAIRAIFRARAGVAPVARRCDGGGGGPLGLVD